MRILGTDTTPLKQTMYRLNVTQAELCRMTGIAYPQMNTYCNGGNTPGEKIMQLIANALGVPIEEVFPE